MIGHLNGTKAGCAFGCTMGKMIVRRSLRLRLNPRRNAIVALLGLCLNCVWLWPTPLHALDPNKRIICRFPPARPMQQLRGVHGSQKKPAGKVDEAK